MEPERLEVLRRRMRQEWDARALHDAPYFVRQSVLNQAEASFDASGALNVHSFVEPDLELICGDRDPRTLRVLEIGCGIGRLTRYLGRLFGEVHGVDVSPEMIRKGRERLADMPHIHLHEGSGVDLGLFPGDYFDFAFSYIVFQHIPDRAIIESYLRDVRRVLRPGRVFKFQVHGGAKDYVPDRESTWSGVVVAQEDVSRWAQAFDFDVVSTRGFGTQYAWVTLRSGNAAKRPSPPRPLPRRPETTSASVRIVVPIFGESSIHTEALEKLFEHTREPGARFVLVDCRRSPGTLPRLPERATVLKGEASWSFADALALGSRELDSPYWAALSERAAPEDGWLSVLVRVAEEHPEIDAVGAPLLAVSASGHVERLTPDPESCHAPFELWDGGIQNPGTVSVGAVLFRGGDGAHGGRLVIEDGTWVSRFDLDPEFYRPWLVDFGRRYEDNGQPEEARERYEACLALFPDEDAARAGLERLGLQKPQPGTRGP